MGFIVTNSVELSVGGEPRTNIWGAVKFHTDFLFSEKGMPCDIKFYNSEVAFDAGEDAIIPVVNGVKVLNCTILFSPDDVIKQSGVCKFSNVVQFMYQKTKENLESTYGWTITL